MPALSLPDVETRPTATTTFTVKVDGQALPGSLRIISIDISREINRVPAATLVLYDGDAAAQEFEASSGELLTPGKKVEIEAGYASDENLLFMGTITGQRIQARGRGDSLLQVEARDPSFRMTLERKSRYFTEITDADLFDEIIGGYDGLSADVGQAPDKHAEVVQYQVSDWDFIVTRAEALGMYCLADNGTLRIAKPDLGQTPAATLSFGRNAFNLDLALDARTQLESVSASTWSPADQALLESEVDDVAAPKQGNLSGTDLASVGKVAGYDLRHTGALPQAVLDAWAQARMLKSRFARIRGTIGFQGTGDVLPGGLIELSGMGDRFNGSAFVSGVRHSLGGSDWQTTAQIGLRPEWHHEIYPVNAAPAAGLHPAINGLHPGIVTQLQDDPAGEDRILVRLPLISASDDGVWSRVATWDAGKDRGAVFRPEIGDEVIVGFIHDDPNYPIVLGMLHSSAKPAPIPAKDENHEKGLVTRSGMKVVFNDDTPSLTIETPGGNRIIIDDKEKQIRVEDETGNTITLSKDGISLESPKDILLKATGDVSIEGVNVEVKASAAAKIEGSGSAALKSSGTTEVKGSLVNIN